MIKQGLPNVKKHKVVVLSITYNHAKYIEETLKGFAMQQTDFPFLCCVFDDASTDGEQEVLKRWVESHCNSEEVEVYDHPLTTILKAPDKNNTNCIYVIHLQKINTWGRTEKDDLLNYWREQGEYIALCEGDDYWIDSLKLQKQVDFLNENLDYILVHSDFIALNGETGEKIRNASSRYKIYEGNVFENLFEACFVRTPTICYRNINLELKTTDLPINTFGGDLFLFYNLASKGKFHFMHEETCVYRVLKESASHTSSAKIRKLRWQKYKNLDYFIANYFNVNQAIISMLDYKWFKIDLRICIATNDSETLKGLVLPGPKISIVDKYLYYCCKSRLIMLILCVFLKIKGMFGCNKWF